ncbi:hypothetical protein M758_5G028100 [Ceratodon purpureus]|nr:hypothetical protein M758_5G028100 [Ceratodon purpureus]
MIVEWCYFKWVKTHLLQLPSSPNLNLSSPSLLCESPELKTVRAAQWIRKQKFGCAVGDGLWQAMMDWRLLRLAAMASCDGGAHSGKIWSIAAFQLHIYRNLSPFTSMLTSKAHM